MPARSLDCDSPRPFGASGFGGASSFALVSTFGLSGSGLPHPARQINTENDRHAAIFMFALSWKSRPQILLRGLSRSHCKNVVHLWSNRPYFPGAAGYVSLTL